jgi:GPH family glycoside/pentoside/hexuronide:cation symporter
MAIVGELGPSLLHPGQTALMYGCAIAMGLGLVTVYLMPLAMLPDVIDLDELRHGQRREGLFYSLMM